MIAGDEGVIRTNDDATNCKRYAIEVGYWKDPFIECFHSGFNKFERKTPEINRGYFARVFSINYLIMKFIRFMNKQRQSFQIVNLGSGFDTLYWKLKAIEKIDGIKSFVDVDMPEVTMKKLHQMRMRPQMLSHLGDDIKYSSMELHSNEYHLVAADLRSTKEMRKKLFTECQLDKSLPTLFLAECVLIYMTVDESNSLLSWISSSFDECIFINYEQVNIFDRFGEIMIENLRQRNCELLDLESCKNLEAQCSRFQNNGWENCNAWDMNTIYKQGIPRHEIERIEKIEFLDEENLLEQLLKHYCLVVAIHGFKNASEIVEEISF
ncbi:leucine carboxyl methyltransferase 1-like protein [Dinothrombium tinctorium]|uniref:Leucine carboxyl methyltransferase 1 n=1 Tax=Dinothrombium tinctorium TaxID=1965070 RepID=A0A3S3PK00_9ACAR|nr:leucine carboxyl methyltransferase 1-like protein [Dinothrombium tinctorium]RWS11252.1 leucine carboxyl methyltransferase 1-like protein [Dinothrombium tinctorium]